MRVIRVLDLWVRLPLVIAWHATVVVAMVAARLVFLRSERALGINHWAATSMSRGTLWLLGIGLEAPSLAQVEAPQPCVYVFNHQSALDTFTFGTLCAHRTWVVGKKELKWIPIFGTAFWAGGNVFLDRQRSAQAIQALQDMFGWLKRVRGSLIFFPEGTRNKMGHGMLPFKKGAFHIAIQGQLPVVPLVSSPVDGKVSLLRGVDRSTPVRIRILESIPVQGYGSDDAGKLAELTRERMLQAYLELGGQP